MRLWNREHRRAQTGLLQQKRDKRQMQSTKRPGGRHPGTLGSGEAGQGDTRARLALPEEEGSVFCGGW